MIEKSINTQVKLTFAYDAQYQRTIMAERKAGGLCSISKPYRENDILGLQLVNPTAGLFAGDSLGMEVTVESGAQVAITSPSASRFHTMHKSSATIEQSFHVGSGASLDFWPETTIPQKDSEVTQTTSIEIGADAEMTYLESFSPGRLAHKENYLFRSFESRFKIIDQQELAVKERLVLTPEKSVWPLQVPDWDTCYYGAIWMIHNEAEAIVEELQTDLNDNPTEGIHSGVTLLTSRIAVLRILTPTSMQMRDITLYYRTLLSKHFKALNIDFRKL